MPGRSTPYHAILGEAFETLHPNVRRAHEAPLTAEGTFDVVHGTHRFTRILVALMKLPAAGRQMPVTLSVAEAGPFTLRWERKFGQTPLCTHQHAHQGYLVEAMGPGRMVFSLRVADGCLFYDYAAVRFLFVRVPTVLSPRVGVRVSPEPEGWHVDVRVEWHGHLICEYGGRMRPLQAAA